MELIQQIWMACFVLALMLLGTHPVLGSFIIPEPALSNLSQWASVQVDQVCLGNCYSGFSNVSCSKSQVCRSQEICNGRTTLPPVEYPLRDWPKANNSDGCRVTNTQPAKPPPAGFINDSNEHTLIVNGSADELSPCYTRRNGSVDSIFTLVFLLMAKCGNCSVLELTQNGKQSVHIRVVNNQICVDIECQGIPNINHDWVLISVRVIRNRLTIYVDEAPFQGKNTTLADFNNGDILIGSEEIAAIGDVFYLYHVRYYRDALTLREINDLKTGNKNHSIQFEECQCSVDYLEEAGDINCTNGVSYYPRFNTTDVFNAASATVDGDSNTYWASSDQGNVTLTLHFNVSFQIESIVIMFGSGSVLPQQVSYSLFSGEQLKNSGYLQCDSTCWINMTSLNNRSTAADMASYLADKAQIQLRRQIPEEKRNFIIIAIEVTGRCDCSGNADSCVLNYENKTYSCSCKEDTHTLSQHCQSCSPNYFRSPDQFDCPNSCHCNNEGVANISNQCEEIGGKCKCKKNVEGQMCDGCKPLSQKFGSSPSDGCEDCYCYQNGTLTCSDTNGSCVCRPNTQPPACDKCMQYSYGFNNPEGCQQCGCTVAGTVRQDMTCNEYTGQCNCKTNVQGLRCESCKSGFYGMETANQQGCKPCECNYVGTDTGVCEASSGQCPCRGGVIINKNCAPVIVSVDPVYGPFVGGTLVTVSGNLLGNTTHNMAVFLSETQQDLVSASDNVVIFRTVIYNTSSQIAPQLMLSWNSESKPFNAQTTFTYRANPVLDISRAQNVTIFASGGCQVRVYGTNLQSVKYPQLEVALSSNPMNRTAKTCRLITDYVICPVPDLRGLYTSAMDKFQMTAIFDGVKSSEIGNIEVKPDPHLDYVGTIRFQYPFEDTITLPGKGLTSACQKYEFTVLTGVINCAIDHISDTEIKCEPAVSPPNGYKYLPIQVIVGDIRVTVGTLQYLALQETTGFIIIISCVCVAIAIAIAVVVFCLCWRRRKGKSARPLITSDDKELAAGETNMLNAYSGFPESTVEPAILSNGHTEIVHKETIFQEPKKGIVNTEAEDSIFKEEFLPKVDEGLGEDIKKCYVGAGHFVLGRHCAIKGKRAQLIDGSLQKSRSPAVKLTIKSLIHPVTESRLPAWGNLALSECLRLHKCKHPHVLSIVGIGINKDQFHILYPRMSQYVLKTLIADANKQFSARQLISFGQQVAEGIAFLASKDITHKDVAARNCMVDEHSVVKLSDAAFSWDFFEEEYVYDEQRERYLPIRWMAPESITDGYYDRRSDVWSFAVLVWELLTRGCLPYHEATSSSEISNFITQGYILGKPDIMNESMYDLLCYCWSQENEHRPSITDVSKSLGQILETDDDGTYANAAEVTEYMKNQSRNVVKLRQSPGDNKSFTTSRLSRV